MRLSADATRRELADAARRLRARQARRARGSTSRRSTTSASRCRCGSSTSRIATPNRFSRIVQVMPMSSLVVQRHRSRSATGRSARRRPCSACAATTTAPTRSASTYVPRRRRLVRRVVRVREVHRAAGVAAGESGVQFDDPTRDWTTDGADKAQPFTASMDLLKLLRRRPTSASRTTTATRESLYVYGLAPNSTLPPVVQLPPVVNELQRATVDVRYHLTRHLGAGLVVLVRQVLGQRLRARARRRSTSLAQPSFLMIGYLSRRTPPTRSRGGSRTTGRG